MTKQDQFESAIDYAACRYGPSRIQFRGPARPLDGPYVALVGGSETYGKFVEAPFADLLEAELGEPMVNLGVMQAGLTLIADDPSILDIASRARMAVVQVLGAQNMSNRFYTVHPRRNDRFVGASETMQALFPDIDFTEFNFTGHLLGTLAASGLPGFPALVEELRTAWVSRMRRILTSIDCECLLLWVANRSPDGVQDVTSPLDPLFVDREMLEALAPHAAAIVEVVRPPLDPETALAGKSYLPSEAAAAAAMPGPREHAAIAEVLARTLRMPSLDLSDPSPRSVAADAADPRVGQPGRRAAG